MVDQSPDPAAFDFVTVTMSEKLRTFDACLKIFPDAWRRLYAALRRAQPDFSYVLIPELHKDGRIHVHMVVRYAVPEIYFIHHKRKENTLVRRMSAPGKMDKFWKDLPRAYGWGYANDQEHLDGDTGKVAFYVAKYLAKQRKVNEWPKNFKHVRHSNDVPALPVQTTALDDLSWLVFVAEDRLIEKISAYRQAGYRLFAPNTGELL